jgi:hypothetical protein
MQTLRKEAAYMILRLKLYGYAAGMQQRTKLRLPGLVELLKALKVYRKAP